MKVRLGPKEAGAREGEGAGTPPPPPSGPLGSGGRQLFSWRRSPLVPPVIWMRRGLACSATGMRRVRTPAS
ncbi:hypothetical protein Saso_29300 [Streptomyces asoensis]|uniref:Uncharacterized protein n=1 Tax=Streptomyces asoensis TaxID=249586 RepID=A0ABQ3RZI7_9ACTN|nr:hypothetical protein GCM10010496_10880 [Streptomyces asoensis]GHI61280.1 hypothetical protein Saso_29300 [Streptomyces asoensis]